jgi:hypothetical protein
VTLCSCPACGASRRGFVTPAEGINVLEVENAALKERVVKLWTAARDARRELDVDRFDEADEILRVALTADRALLPKAGGG